MTRNIEEALSGLGLSATIDPEIVKDTLIVFDWDDTILPTSWLERTQALCVGGGPLRTDLQRQITALVSASATTLQLARQLGTVIFITNSAPGWMDQSCQLFMPTLHPEIRSTPISAKPMNAPITFKIAAFRREVRQYTNIISIGDGDAERTASLRLSAPHPCASDQKLGSRRIKSLKLVDLPTCQQLISQHEMLQIRLADVVAFQGSLDLKSRFSSCPGILGSPTGAIGHKVATCALVHFARPQATPFTTSDAFAFRSCSTPTATSRVPSAPGRSPAVPDSGTQASVKMMALRGPLPPALKTGGSSSALPPLGIGLPGDELASPSRSQSSVEHDERSDRAGSPSRSRLWKVQGVGDTPSQGFSQSMDLKKKHGLVGAPGNAPRAAGLGRPIQSNSWSATGRA